METYQKLGALRAALKQTQYALAEGIGLTQPQISRYERGENDIGQKVLESICAFWCISVVEFHSLDISALYELVKARADKKKGQ